MVAFEFNFKHFNIQNKKISDANGITAGINRSNTAVQAVLKQPCLTGGRTGTV
jgi:hypothetical protein